MSTAPHLQESDRRAEVLSAARGLFIHHGFTRVSMREIAAEAHMSVGNLTYYFPRKRDLVEAVLADFRQGLLENGTIPGDLPQLWDFLLRSQRLLENNALYFSTCSHACAARPAAELQERAAADLDDLCGAIFRNLEAAGLLVPQGYTGQRRALAASIQLAFRHWADFCRTAEEGSQLPSFRDCIWSILYPNLTPEGQAIAGRLAEQNG